MERRLRDEDAQETMQDLGSEVFNLKLAVQEYEDRLAKLYQTEDRSRWKGPATLLVSSAARERTAFALSRAICMLCTLGMHWCCVS